LVFCWLVSWMMAQKWDLASWIFHGPQHKNQSAASHHALINPLPDHPKSSIGCININCDGWEAMVWVFVGWLHWGCGTILDIIQPAHSLWVFCQLVTCYIQYCVSTDSPYKLLFNLKISSERWRAVSGGIEGVNPRFRLLITILVDTKINCIDDDDD
jgi:hypothetical protein